MSRRSWRAALLVSLLAAVTLTGPALAAPAGGGTASVSDTTPQPGQSVTVTGSGLKAGTDVVIDYVPDAVRLAVIKASADGSFSQSVRIPANSYDGPKQIVVTSLDASGKFTRLKIDMTMSGPPATVELSDMTLVPNQVIRVTGNRWYANAQVLVVLFPEGVNLGPITAGSNGTFATDVRLPKDLLNGKHGVQIFGRAGGGRMANLKLYPTVSGGIGKAGSFEIPDEPLDPTSSTVPTSTTMARSTTSVTEPLTDLDSGGSNLGTLVLILGCLLLLIAVAVGWYYSSEGKAWRRSRAQRRGARRKA